MAVEPVPHDHDFQLEKALLAREHARADAWQRKNRQALESLLDDNFIEINALGRFSKKEVLNVLLEAVTLHALSIDKPRLLALGSDAVILTYRCNETVTVGGERQEIPAHVTALYVMHDKQWKLLLWQITPVTWCGPAG
jgi:hypothetical protein